MKDDEQKLIAWQETALKQPVFNFIKKIIKQFPAAEIYLVGGAVRDILLGRETKDFDFVIAKVEAKELERFLAQEGKINLVGKSFGVFKFVPFRPLPNPPLQTRGGGIPEEEKIDPIDIALPRTEHAGMSGGYRDFEIQSDKDLPIAKDLGRRDFTINALAWDIYPVKYPAQGRGTPKALFNGVKNQLIDPYGGIGDLENKIIKAIGKPEQRFQEDYTRMLRAIRFACQLDFAIESKTLATIKKKAKEILTLPAERINEEFTKIIMSDNAENGLRLMEKIGLLKNLIPELQEGVGIKQNREHIYEVFEHGVRALGAGAQKNFKLEVRLAALFHDVGKPRTKEGEGPDSTFYNHDQVGAKMTQAILRRLKYPNDLVKYVTHLVRYHMFYYALDTVSDAGVRRLLNRLGQENIDDFINLRICDRLGMGRPKAKPWKLIELERRFKEVVLEPITPKMIKLNGSELMEILKIKPGPKIGLILNALLGEILEKPEKNEKEYLTGRVKELNKLSDEKLKALHPDLKFYEEERKRLVHRKNAD